MPKILANNINLYYEIHGKGETLIFIAGFAVDHIIWDNIVDTFAQKYQVILLDNRGVGQSDCPKYPYTIEMMADDTIALCKALQINKAVFIGNSMGGAIVQNIAYRYPNYVRTTVISNSFIKLNKFTIFLSMQMFWLALGVPRRFLIKQMLPKVYSQNYLQKVGLNKLVDIFLANPYPITVRGYYYQWRALIKFDSSAWINSIKVPCLVLSSQKDQLTPREQAEAVADTIPNATYHCFPDVGHLPHAERPDLFNKVVLDFLNR